MLFQGLFEDMGHKLHVLVLSCDQMLYLKFVSLCCPLLTHFNHLCFQASHTESDQALQRRLEEVCEELRTTQSRNSSLQATLDKTQQENSTLSGERLVRQVFDRTHWLQVAPSLQKMHLGDRN